MGRRSDTDWEAIEREYRAGQLTVVEIGRQHGLSHTAINKRAKRDGWTRNLAEKVRKEVSARLVSAKVSPETERDVIELAAARGVQVVREHRASIGRGQRLINTLFGELEEATDIHSDIEVAIEDETAGDKTSKRRTMMLRAVDLPSRASVILSLSTALKTLVGLERQAFSLDEEESASGDFGRMNDDDLRASISADIRALGLEIEGVAEARAAGLVRGSGRPN